MEKIPRGYSTKTIHNMKVGNVDMIKETVTYIDHNGEQQTDDLYFSLSKLEATLMIADAGGDIEGYINKLQKAGDVGTMMRFIADIILKAYGEKSPDGRQFIKSQQVKDQFEYSVAYAELFEQLLSDPERVKRFSHGVFKTAMANTKGDNRAKLEQIIK